MKARLARHPSPLEQDCEQIRPPSSGHQQRQILLNPLQFGLGCILLGVGLGFYYLYRTVPIALFELIGINTLNEPITPALAHHLANSLPSFIHVLSLSLFTGALIRPGYLRYLGVCLFWLLIDSAFEVAQAYGTAILAGFPQGWQDMPLLGALDDYLRYGAYDLMDMTAILLGACLAYGVLVLSGKRLQHGYDS